MKKLMSLLVGNKSCIGENIITKTPTFRTVIPTEQLSFKEWAEKLNVSATFGKQITDHYDIYCANSM